MPLYCRDGQASESDSTAQAYFQSLRLLETKFGLQTIEVNAKPYPYNLLLSAWDAERKIRKADPSINFHVCGGSIVLSNGDYLKTGSTLFYVPVKPLFMLMHKKGRKEKQCVQLLLSMFSYLYHCAAIPYYTEGSYVGWNYEIISEWIAEEISGCATRQNEADAALIYGEIVKRKFCHECHLSDFKIRLAAYRPSNVWEADLLNTASGIFCLWKDYPDSNIFSHILPVSAEDEQDIIRIDQYISFVATTEDCLAETLTEMVSNSFNECSDMDAPLAFTVFGKDGKVSEQTYDYEKALLSLLDDLCYLLNTIV